MYTKRNRIIENLAESVCSWSLEKYCYRMPEALPKPRSQMSCERGKLVPKNQDSAMRIWLKHSKWCVGV